MKKLLFATILICLGFPLRAQYNREVTLEKILQTDTTSIGQKIAYPAFASDEVTILKVTIPPGKSTGWHKHGIPVFAYVMKGTLTVEVENGKDLQFPENSSFAEIINVNHNGTNRGKEDVVLIAVYLGEKGGKLSVRRQ